MIIPIGTDNPLQRRPVVNYCLLAANIIVFLLTYGPHRVGVGGGIEPLKEGFEHLKLFPTSPEPFQFITYAFLHAGWGHLLGNMLFLYIFGNNVNEKLGHVGYSLLYLGGAVFAGLGHALFEAAPVLGASGAVATVTGAYMVLFPNTYIRVLYFFFFIGTMEIRALYLILFKMILYDNVIVPRLSAMQANIAFGAHLAGYLYGIIICLLLLILRFLPHSHYDLWGLIRRWRRRRQYASMVNTGYEPYEAAPVGRRRVQSKVTDTDSPPTPHAEEIATLRARIAQHLAESDLTGAVGAYEKLLRIDPEQVLPQQSQLDVANKLVQMAHYEQAAHAYEAFLKAYPAYPFIEQVRLMLGLIYSRYLRKPEPAKKHLSAALDRLSDTGQRQMCQDELQLLK